MFSRKKYVKFILKMENLGRGTYSIVGIMTVTKLNTYYIGTYIVYDISKTLYMQAFVTLHAPNGNLLMTADTWSLFILRYHEMVHTVKANVDAFIT